MARQQKVRAVEFTILGKVWTMRILKRKKYNRKNGLDSVAITHINKRRIDLGPGGDDLETIIHELVHAYLTEICTKSALLDDEQLEEIFAELMSKRGREMLDLADDLFAKVKDLTVDKIVS